LSQLPHHKNLSSSLEISLFYQAVYLLDNPVSGLSFVPTIIAALHPSNTESSEQNDDKTNNLDDIILHQKKALEPYELDEGKKTTCY